jgi:hypothetical protein
MFDPTGEEQVMRATAATVGALAVLAFAPLAHGANVQPQVRPAVDAQVVKAQVVKAQVVKAQVVKAQVVKAQVVKAQVVKAQVASLRAPRHQLVSLRKR